MTRPTLLMLHGWGFDAQLWDPLADALADYPIIRWDRGYFGALSEQAVAAPLIGIGHSLGAMLLAERLPEGTPLIAINGFDHFTGPDAVPSRIVERMRTRFAETPREVLIDFRARCGAASVAGPICEERLAADLTLLATGRVASRRDKLLVLNGSADPILPPILRDTAFPGNMRAEQPEAGHLLPLTHPGWCAERIEAFLCE